MRETITRETRILKPRAFVEREICSFRISCITRHLFARFTLYEGV